MANKSKSNSEKSLNIAFTGGGTGGHIYPCLAVIEELISNSLDANIYYLGNKNKLEYKLLSENDLKDYRGLPFSSYIKFLAIEAEPLIRSFNPIKIISWFWRFYKQIGLCKKYLVAEKIHVVFGTGGYVSGPVFAAARALKIPYVIHNLDAFIGIANAFFVKDAYTLSLGLECKQNIKPKNGKRIVTGNPISKKFLSELISLEAERSEASQSIHLLITGGSQGAESINNAIGEILPELSKLNIFISHVTGTKTYEDFVNKFLDGNRNKYPNYQVEAYTHEMPLLCNQADISVCRAGAMTIAEICVSGVVPIFVPLPWAAHDHQNLNAQTLVESGAAISLDQDTLDFKTQLLNSITELVSNPTKLNSMQNKLSEFSKPDAAKNIIRILEGIISENKSL